MNKDIPVFTQNIERLTCVLDVADKISIIRLLPCKVKYDVSTRLIAKSTRDSHADAMIS